MMLTLPPDYVPSDSEEFMNPLQVEYFRQKLLRWRADLLREADGTLASLSEGGIHEADITDRASVETDRALELRTRDRARKLISKIDQALQRVENGSYGYCEETGEPIGLKRLEAHRHALAGSAGAPRAHGARAPRRLGGEPRRPACCTKAMLFDERSRALFHFGARWYDRGGVGAWAFDGFSRVG